MQLKPKIERFLRSAVYDEEEPFTGFHINHCPSGGKPSPVKRRTFAEPQGVEDVETVADEIVQVTTDDATGMGGVQRYQVIPLFGGKAKGRLMIRVEGYSDGEFDEFDSEGPSNRGLVAQQMRHNEALIKSSHAAFGGIMTQMQRLLMSQSQHIEKLLEQRMEDFKAIEEAQSAKHEREMEMLQLAGKEERNAKLFEQGSLLLPAIVNRIGGKKLLPEKATPEMTMLKGFVESVTPEQFNKLLGIFQPGQQIALVELMQSFSTEEG